MEKYSKGAVCENLFILSFCRNILGFLKAVDLQLVGSNKSSFRQPAANLGALIALKLKNFSVFRVFYDCTIASEFL